MMGSEFSSRVVTVSPSLAMPAPPVGRGLKAAREFEAQLIGSLLESMEKTFATLPGDNSMPGADDYGYLGTQALAGALAERGGFGIAAVINRYFEAHESKE
jgi:Rod binding domain-containing protein